MIRWGSCIASPDISIIIPLESVVVHSRFVRCRIDDAHDARIGTPFHCARFPHFFFEETLRWTPLSIADARRKIQNPTRAYWRICKMVNTYTSPHTRSTNISIHTYIPHQATSGCCSFLIAQVSFSHLSFCQIRYQRIGTHRDRCRCRRRRLRRCRRRQRNMRRQTNVCTTYEYVCVPKNRK